ncbi:hypothetical protein PhiBTCVTUL1a_46 [Burkholderia phage phiBtTUL1a]|nr:hypothetical protein PhiBTCVTUL1a_46 [Burkholderia phage phiBtTUL1a]
MLGYRARQEIMLLLTRSLDRNTHLAPNFVRAALTR